MTIQQALENAWRQLDDCGITGSRLDGELLLAHVLKTDRAQLLAHSDETLAPLDYASYQQLIKRRMQHEPVVHLTGTREFYGLDFAITPEVLTPRVETEQLVAWAIQYAPPQSALIDIGTGSGAIAIAIAVHRPDLRVTATELSPTALIQAETNRAQHGITAELVLADLWEPLPVTQTAGANYGISPAPLGTYATVVTNLPYLRDDARDELMPEVRREPAMALFGGADGLGIYRRFLAGLRHHLAPNGFLFTECDPWQHDALIAEAAKVGLTPIEQGYFILGFRASSM